MFELESMFFFPLLFCGCCYRHHELKKRKLCVSSRAMPTLNGMPNWHLHHSQSAIIIAVLWVETYLLCTILSRIYWVSLLCCCYLNSYRWASKHVASSFFRSRGGESLRLELNSVKNHCSNLGTHCQWIHWKISLQSIKWAWFRSEASIFPWKWNVLIIS